MRYYSLRHLLCLWNTLCYVIQVVRLIISTDSITIPWETGYLIMSLTCDPVRYVLFDLFLRDWEKNLLFCVFVYVQERYGAAPCYICGKGMWSTWLLKIGHYKSVVMSNAIRVKKKRRKMAFVTSVRFFHVMSYFLENKFIMK